MPRPTADPPLQGTFGYRPTTVHRRLPPLRQQQLQHYLNSHNPARSFISTTTITNNSNNQLGYHINNTNIMDGSVRHLSLGTIQVETTTTSALERGDKMASINGKGRYVGLITTPIPISPARGRRPSSRPRQPNPHPLTAAAIAHNRSSLSRPTPTPKIRTSFNVGVPDLTPELVSQYLKQNPEVLDEFVVNHVRNDQIEKWVQRKSTLANTRNSISRLKEVENTLEKASDKTAALSRWKAKLQTSKGRVLQELAKDFQNANGKLLVLLELADCVSAAISADSHILFSCDEEKQEITHISKSDKGEIVFGVSERMGVGTSLAASVAFSKETARLKDLLENKRNPDGLSVNDIKAHSVLGLPILDDMDSCLGIIEFYRYSRNSSFSKEEEEVAVLLLQWYDMLLDYVETHSTMTRQSTLSDFLLEVTRPHYTLRSVVASSMSSSAEHRAGKLLIRSIFQDIVSMDLVIMKIMNFAKALVDADRASLFLLDTRSSELYARIFDDGNSLEEVCAEHDHLHHEEDSGSGGEGAENVSQEYRAKREGWKKKAEKLQKDIRFSMDIGVAGYVARTGKILNIKDAYKDKRFNRQVDIKTGYHTKTILCMPIFIRKQVIGVVQMVNKLNGTFTKADEKAFETFAIYCGLALHHAKLYEKIRRSEQKYKVALECLSYHSMVGHEEFSKYQKRTIPDSIPNITMYYFSPWSVTNDDKPLYVLYMFKQLFHNINYEMDDVIRFTLTVRKNYRDVPYHNWLHAFSVAHSMFTIIKTAVHNLSPIEAIVLFVACLCHDLDHRGKTNSFMVQSASPLAAVYTTSTMEHHHFNQTVSILQREDHNIFKFLSSHEYKKVLGDMKSSILATDLAVFFKNKAMLENIVKQKAFDWRVEDHRIAKKAIMMTSCDLCAMYKPWSIQYDLVYVIMEEFWQQGDEERKRGIVPMEMMDRKKKNDLPRLEVGFMESICVPCYSLMANIMPDTAPMLEGAKANLRKWQQMAKELTKTEGSEI